MSRFYGGGSRSNPTTTPMPRQNMSGGATNYRQPARLTGPNPSGYPKLVLVGVVGPPTANPALEDDAAQPLGRVKVKAIGTATETEAAVALVRVHKRTLGQGLETETSIALGRISVRTLGVVTESDAAVALGRSKRSALGVVPETDAAIPITRLAVTILRVLGAAVETDLALPIRLVRSVKMFSPPTHEVSIRSNAEKPLPYYRLTTANTVVKVGGQFVQIRTPNPELLVGLEGGVDYFRGGYEYVISTELAAELVSAGYEVTTHEL